LKIRGRNLEDEDIAKIVAVIDGWSGKLTWELLIDALESRKFARYTRQTLHKHPRIAEAFATRKNSSVSEGKVSRVDSPEMQVCLERIARVETENDRLKRENHTLLEQFARWAYNAHSRGLDKEFLDRPLPNVNRDQSRLKEK
jgi:hypothetical protein